MKFHLLLVATAGILLASGATSAHAQSAESIKVTNDSQNAVWVTTYVAPDRRSSIIKAMCVPSGTQSWVKAQTNTVGGWVLFEIKKDPKSCAVHSNEQVIEKKVMAWATLHSANNSTVISSK